MLRKLIFYLLFIPVLAVGRTEAANRAGVVVRHSNGRVAQKCIDFESDSISGYDLLVKASLNPKLERGFIVSVDGEEAKSAWDLGASSNYWSYWAVINGKWDYQHLGSTSTKIKNGQVDGWQIGDSALRLPFIPFEQLCPVTEKPAAAVELISPGVAPDENSLPPAVSGTAPERTPTPVVSAPADLPSNDQNKVIASTLTDQTSGVVRGEMETGGDIKRPKDINLILVLIIGLGLALGFGLRILINKSGRN